MNGLKAGKQPSSLLWVLIKQQFLELLWQCGYCFLRFLLESERNPYVVIPIRWYCSTGKETRRLLRIVGKFHLVCHDTSKYADFIVALKMLDMCPWMQPVQPTSIPTFRAWLKNQKNWQKMLSGLWLRQSR